jgi:putative nucleotidyltransferase with HDIG domain
MKERVLVVDGDSVTREIVASMLVSADYSCTQASDGMEALARLDAGEEIELIVTELMMADVDGMQLLERTKDKYPDTPVLLMTSLNNMSVALTAIRYGASDYLLKPFDVDQLLRMVRQALESRRIKFENRAYQSNLESLVAKRTDDLRCAMVNLERSYDFMLEGFGDALCLKDAEAAGHCRRVMAFSISIARAMNLPAQEIRVLARAAFLHDIGKLAIPDMIIRKPGKLNRDEVAIMRDHPYHGYQMLRKIPVLQEASEIVYAHHERYDGTGYPRGLRGEQIPLGARIVAVANTFDSITSNLVYRKSQSLSAARAEIERWSRRQFDPEVVRSFFAIPDNAWADMRREIDSGIAAVATTINNGTVTSVSLRTLIPSGE